MSIATEITSLNNNLSDAKTAVTTKGGTVGDTGLAGLADEIATIPTGGSLENYGSITYLDNNNTEQTLTLATEEDYLELTIGGASADITINNMVVNKSNIKSVTVADGVQYLPNNFLYGCDNLTTVNIPSSVHFIGSAVFLGCSSLNSPLNLANVIYVGDSFLQSGVGYNQPINLPKVREIGGNFMYNCTSFNSSLTLNDDTEVIGNRFLSVCTSFAQPFTIPSGLVTSTAVADNPGERFMYNCNNFVGPLTWNVSTAKAPIDNYTLGTNNSSASMYNTGVTLTGLYAQTWKNALPDRTSSPYRKIIVGS